MAQTVRQVSFKLPANNECDVQPALWDVVKNKQAMDNTEQDVDIKFSSEKDCPKKYFKRGMYAFGQKVWPKIGYLHLTAANLITLHSCGWLGCAATLSSRPNSTFRRWKDAEMREELEEKSRKQLQLEEECNSYNCFWREAMRSCADSCLASNKLSVCGCCASGCVLSIAPFPPRTTSALPEQAPIC
ncbi:Hypothetical predicted protein [Cloeon dipterum]|uniref:Uncharacterized protein n=1 Tax=Cloeon dipterum TaxID=197152 RepID=A0A8S1D4W4_9INSE|nr:Hypothetical predicted protein [Cloeon dipterum]